MISGVPSGSDEQHAGTLGVSARNDTQSIDDHEYVPHTARYRIVYPRVPVGRVGLTPPAEMQRHFGTPSERPFQFDVCMYCLQGIVNGCCF